MPMKPKPNKHDRRSYNQSPGGSWRELDRAQEQTKQMPGVMPTQYPNGGCPPYHNENSQGLNSGVRKTAKPKVFTPSDIEYSDGEEPLYQSCRLEMGPSTASVIGHSVERVQLSSSQWPGVLADNY